jgi:CheY-like chemotaxis protein
MNKPKILIVDDKAENLVALETLLCDLDVDFVRALSGNEALQKTLEHQFALALIDVQMPEMDGFETVQFMRQSKATALLPVIFVSAIYNTDYYKIKGVQAGAVDFITKPVVPEILIGKVRIFLQLHQQRLQLEHMVKELRTALDNVKTLSGLIPICSHCKKIRNDAGFWDSVEHFIAQHSDVDFSHAICPDCMQKLYPKVYNRMVAEGKIAPYEDHE